MTTDEFDYNVATQSERCKFNDDVIGPARAFRQQTMQLAKEALDNDISSSNTICHKPGMMYQTNGLHFRSYMYMSTKLSFGFL